MLEYAKSKFGHSQPFGQKLPQCSALLASYLNIDNKIRYSENDDKLLFIP